jgi:4-carboxymuconolactone decarboxylase
MDDQLYEQGLNSRRKIHGDAFVSHALEAKDSRDADFQRFVTEYCWGAAWSQDGASLRERSLIALGMFAARSQYDEFRLHCRGLLRNGYSATNLLSLTRQIAVYCGVTVGISCHRIIREVIDEAEITR